MSASEALVVGNLRCELLFVRVRPFEVLAARVRKRQRVMELNAASGKQ